MFGLIISSPPHGDQGDHQCEQRNTDTAHQGAGTRDLHRTAGAEVSQGGFFELHILCVLREYRCRIDVEFFGDTADVTFHESWRREAGVVFALKRVDHSQFEPRARGKRFAR